MRGTGIIERVALLTALSALGCNGGSQAASSAEAGMTTTEGGAPVYSLRQPVEAGTTTVIEFGEAGAPTSCAARPELSPDLVRACVLRTSCIAFQPPYSVSQCLSDNALAHETVDAGCVMAATDCAHLAPCVSNELAAQPCVPGDHLGHCYGNTFVYCDGQTPYWENCTQLGLTCLLDDSSPDGGTGSTYGCVQEFVPNSTYCAQGFTSGCLKGQAADCDQYGDLNYIDCVGTGQACVVDPVVGAECVPPAPSCDGGVTSCSSQGTASNCDSLGRLETSECGKAGLSCVSGGGSATCVAPGCSQNDVQNCQESCDGPYLNVCVGGGRYVIDCREYGFTSCQLTSSQSAQYGGKDYAECIIY
jgi:hypothetical protein